MIDSFDYKEPSCKLCGGKEFYYPDKDAPLERIPVKRIIEKLDGFFEKNDLEQAGKLLEYWQNEAVLLKDLQGELSIINELLGYYRKVNLKEKGLNAVKRANELITLLDSEFSLSSATIYLNMATTLKAFSYPEKALLLYDKAGLIYDKHQDVEDSLIAGYYNNRALTLVDLKEFIKAEIYYHNALDKLKNSQNLFTDGAITYVNMAHLYDEIKKPNMVTDCMFKACELLFDEKVIKNGYYAYVLEKCAPSFRFFGFDKIANDLEKLSGEIYERN